MPLVPKPARRLEGDELFAAEEAQERRIKADLESYGMSQGSAEDLTDRYDPAERAYQDMEREERGQPHPNEWAR